MVNRVKESGEIFTPEYLVRNMLDFVGYEGALITSKHVIDNSAGEGAFLAEIVRRYCEQNTDKKLLKKHLETYIHGIELDTKNYAKCIESLDAIALEFDVANVKWDIQNASTLEVGEYDGKMDFVVGNPPYVRVHNLKESHKAVKKFLFSSVGMTDLYITFYELSFRMLNPTGRMCLITPSSFLTSRSGLELRKYIAENHNLAKVIDVGHFQPFVNATTYTFITMFDMSRQTNVVEYYTYDSRELSPVYSAKLSYDEIFVDDKMYFGTTNQLRTLSAINENLEGAAVGELEVKNGLATLGDKIFINDFDFDDSLIIDTLKASRGKWRKAIYPYDKNGRLVDEQELKTNHTELYNYLLSHKDKLEARSLDKRTKWYAYGRSQAIGDVSKNKLAINTTIKDLGSLKLIDSPAGTAVYSGLYILYEGKMGDIKDLIMTEEFIEYVQSLKKYKSGGYYTFSSKDLKKFLAYKLITKLDNNTQENPNEQPSLFTYNQQIVSEVS